MVRVRFAPSPTGQLHIGGARTALFNYLFAKKHNGKFILRIEDTDLERSREEWAKAIMKSLKWLGIEWDEGPDIGGEFGPYFQSQRKDIYMEYINKLLEEGKAYYCFCSQEEIEKEREIAKQNKVSYKYSKKCRNISLEEAKRRIKNGEKAAVRIKAPQDGVTVVHDIIRGDVEFSNDQLDDFIILKSDGNPTYNFVCVVDDYFMKISHVIRAEEHLSNTPKQLIIYQALNLTPPQFAHVPMILAPDRSKLSKRHGATSVEEFFENGYLKEAIVNYLLLLGWSPGEDRTIIGLDEAIEKFELEKVSKNAAIYDVNKLTWINGHYLKEIHIEDLYERMKYFYSKKGIEIERFDKEYVKSALKLVREKVKTLVEVVDASTYFFDDSYEYDQKGVEKYLTPENLNIVKSLLDELKNLEPFSAPEIESLVRKKAESLNVKAANIIHTIRVCISGRTVTPGLFEMMEVLGKKEVVKRIERTCEKFLIK
ncbi:glutamyl-tRNA synthetase [Caldicellulosiruptor saccharolyticus DSM 8903]|uniref:Glutamate--tRNA ligase 2 n=1 Tax=Caldicellulosiruptor saccharolyticus (strain ATCC 43494 / DSM 8903 / Tp8T 6331) TaxID=351627 RepID=SYE2_CALS8|nr:glutamate--tRNA ligase [Caldicellulosiruptor saccharolyticus]A4XLI3.1 RecName: Full=Glutamate--tRNA ligase 2; AltName: Full=Glutamyl-tRNA synthetase 2; Short=GluRS 2 [Caldicellulosiruptor saccharolyticus DSM 8903]ABP67768.1 glutamyl-tRNA synthetase [Caldicellulosiruptor saccharolyticus DSM 8903]